MGVKKWLALCLLLAVFLTNSKSSYGFQDKQTIANEKNYDKEMLVFPVGKKDIRILRRLGKEKTKELNKDLQKAMTLYFDRYYRLAYQELLKVSKKAPTKDVLYWLSMSALRSGKPEIAANRLKKILKRDPKLNNIRFKLALAYAEMGDFENAKKELQITKEQETSKFIISQIDDLYQKIDRADKKFAFRFSLSAGLKFDDNLGAVPGDGNVPFGIGQISTKKESDFVQVLSSNADLIYDAGDRGDWFWINGINYALNKHPGTRERFDFSSFSFETGARYLGDGFSFEAPYGVAFKRYDRLTDLSTTQYVSPKVTFSLSQDTSLQVGSKIGYENFETSKNTQDALDMSLFISPRFKTKFIDEKGLTSFRFFVKNHDAKTTSLSYEEFGAKVSYSQPINDDETLRGFASVGINYKDYNEPFGFAVSRKDERYDAYLSLSKRIKKDYMISAYYSFSHNDSNAKLYEYDKNTLGLNFTYMFDY